MAVKIQLAVFWVVTSQDTNFSEDKVTYFTLQMETT
jgi:hypothetical protein